MEKAKQALKHGHLQKADDLFAEISADQKHLQSVQLVAEAKYVRGIIAIQEIRWYDAAEHFKRAAQLEPSIHYLLLASKYLDKIAQYAESENLAHQALKKSIDQHGENHPDTAMGYNNVALNLQVQGAYRSRAAVSEGTGYPASRIGCRSSDYKTDSTKLR